MEMPDHEDTQNVDCENEPGLPNCDENDFLDILLATDIHLGYNEKDAIRGNDSFVAFEEILKIGKSKNVDMILLGGDLFHDSRPSMNCILKCSSLIRRYCFGDRPVSIEFLSDQSVNFSHCANPMVNFEDPNINISIPMFSIHGNHDDPSGFGRTCTLELLSSTGLINYFGKVNDLAQIDISPLLIAKGNTKLAIYGLSYVKDDRLTRLFRDKKVRMLRPVGDENEWFNILVLHQNRPVRGTDSLKMENLLPDFLDLVFWGHEHECLINPTRSTTRKFFVTQPGSPVATSLCEGEAVPKHVGILRVCKKQFKLDPIKLETVRPFVFDTIVLSECHLKAGSNKIKKADVVQQYASEYIESMLEKAKDLLTGHPKQPTLPLIRLRIEYSKEDEMFNAIRFGQQLIDRIANPSDVILLRKALVGNFRLDDAKLDRNALEAALKSGDREALIESRVESVLEKYFASEELLSSDKLQVLSVKGLCEGVKQFIDKEDRDAILDVVKSQREKAIQYLENQNACEEDIGEHLETFRLLRDENTDEVNEIRDMLLKRSSQKVNGASRTSNNGDTNINWCSDDDDDGDVEEIVVPARGRGSRGGRGRASRARGAETTTRGSRGRGARGGKGQQPTLEDTFNFTSSSRSRQSLGRNAQRKTSNVIAISDSDSG